MKQDLISSLLLSGGGVISLVGAGGKTTLMFHLAQELAKSGDRILATTTTKVRMPTGGEVASIFISSDPNEVLRRIRGIDGRSGPFFAAAGEIVSEKKLAGFAPEAVDIMEASQVFRWIIVEADGAAQRPLKAPAPHEPVIPEGSGWVIGVLGLDAMGKPLHDTTVFRAKRFSELSGLSLGETVNGTSLARVLAHPEGILKGCPKRALPLVFLNKADTPKEVSMAREVIASLNEMEKASIRRIVIGRLLPDPLVHECYDLGKAGGKT